MNEVEDDTRLMEKIKDMITEGKIDTVVDKIAIYLNLSTEENYIERLENIFETVSLAQGGRTVIRFLIEHLVIDVPSLLENLSKKDSLLRYSFLLLLREIAENEPDLLIPYSNDLLNSEDPNVREAFLQLIIFIAGGDKGIEDESILEIITSKLSDEKDFVVEKAIQALKTIGNKSPSLVTRVLKEFSKKCSENDELIKNIDSILKAIVTVEKIEEIVETEESKMEKPVEELVEKEKELESKEIELKVKEKELKDKEVELEIKEILSDFDLKKIEKEKQLTEKEIELTEKEIELKEKEKEIKLELEEKMDKDELPKDLVREEVEILDKELELKKKDLEIKKKKLEIEEKEKELEEIKIIEKEKTLKIKEELIQKEKELDQVEIELKKKTIEEKERKIKEDEAKRIKERLNDDKQGEN